MTITDSRSVLILGAGASAPFGLPLGGALIDLIYDLIVQELNISKGNVLGLRTASGTSTISIEQCRSKLMTNAFLHSKPEPSTIKGYLEQRTSTKPLTDLAKLLGNQTSQTIDDFIAVNPSVAQLTKLGIATVFFHHLYIYDEMEGIWFLRGVSERHIWSGKRPKRQRRRNWVHHLINLVRHENFPPSKDEIKGVRIINFNYDGILEHVLDTQFGNTGESFRPWEEYIEIVHPHGFIGKPEAVVEEPHKKINAWADAINVVKELVPTEQAREDRKKSREWVFESSYVYMVGFALSASNAEMLGLGHNDAGAQDWHVCNFDGTSGLRRTVEKYVKESNGLIHHFPEEGSRGEQLHIDTWFEIGVPGQLP